MTTKVETTETAPLGDLRAAALAATAEVTRIKGEIEQVEKAVAPHLAILSAKRAHIRSAVTADEAHRTELWHPDFRAARRAVTEAEDPLSGLQAELRRAQDKQGRAQAAVRRAAQRELDAVIDASIATELAPLLEGAYAFLDALDDLRVSQGERAGLQLDGARERHLRDALRTLGELAGAEHRDNPSTAEDAGRQRASASALKERDRARADARERGIALLLNGRQRAEVEERERLNTARARQPESERKGEERMDREVRRLTKEQAAKVAEEAMRLLDEASS
jgi:hypothetical protein